MLLLPPRLKHDMILWVSCEIVKLAFFDLGVAEAVDRLVGAYVSKDEGIGADADNGAVFGMEGSVGGVLGAGEVV
jgi:hypothetical protein